MSWFAEVVAGVTTLSLERLVRDLGYAGTSAEFLGAGGDEALAAIISSPFAEL